MSNVAQKRKLKTLNPVQTVMDLCGSIRGIGVEVFPSSPFTPNANPERMEQCKVDFGLFGR